MLRKLLSILLVLLLWAYAYSAQAKVLNVPPGQDAAELAGYLDVLRDDGGHLTIAEAAQNPSFSALPGFLHEGFTKSVFWLRFTVATEGGEWWLEMTPPYVDDIQVFLPDPAHPGEFASRLLGDHTPLSAQELRHHRPILRFNSAKNSTTTIYVRISTTSSMMLGMRLIRDNALIESTSADLMALGMLYGTSASVFLVALLFGVWMRNSQALLYALYILPSAIAQFFYEGLATRFLFPDSPIVADRAVNVALCLTVAINSLLIRTLLETPIHLPSAARAYKAMSALAALCSIIAATGHWGSINIVFNIFSLFILIFNIFVAAILVRRNRPSAQYFLAGFSVYSVLLMAILMRHLGLMEPLFSPFWLSRIASLFPALIIGAGIARHLRQNDVENRQAQAAALTAAQEAELRLEARVAERTAELQVMVDHVQAQEKTLRNAKNDAETANQAKSAFLAMMSHELRTPMSGVLSVTDLLGGTDLTPHQRDLVRTIGESGQNLLAILNDILDLSKLEHGRIEIERHAFDFPELLRSIAELLQGKADEKSIALNFNLPPNLPSHVEGDPMRIRQILLNLLGNAIKFTEQGAVSLTVRSALLSEGRTELEFVITDTGIGMSQETIATLFTPFQQADASISRRFGGTGLGLAISQRLAVAMEGSISVSSEEGKGSAFTLTLPCAATSPPVVTASMDAAPDLAPLNILLAEDNPLNQRIIPLILSRLRHKVELAVDGAMAVRILSEHPPGYYDIILMDMQMPNMNGLDATRAIRAMGAGYAAIPIIALTANAFDSDRERCLQAGMNGHLCKPLIPNVLNGVLHQVLQAGRRDEERRIDFRSDETCAAP